MRELLIEEFSTVSGACDDDDTRNFDYNPYEHLPPLNLTGIDIEALDKE